MDVAAIPLPRTCLGCRIRASDIVECEPVRGSSSFDVPVRDVRPRGWYNGKYVWWPWPKRPAFRHLEITVLPKSGWGPHVFLKKSDFAQFSSSIIQVAVAARTPADPLFKVEFVRKH